MDKEYRVTVEVKNGLFSKCYVSRMRSRKGGIRVEDEKKPQKEFRVTWITTIKDYTCKIVADDALDALRKVNQDINKMGFILCENGVAVAMSESILQCVEAAEIEADDVVMTQEEPTDDVKATPWDVPVMSVCPWETVISYVATVIKATFLTIRNTGNTVYALLYELNGMQAVDAVSEHNNRQIVAEWLRTQLPDTAVCFHTVLLPGTVDTIADAAAFLADYAKADTVVETKNGNAKAFFDWRNKDEG